MFIVPTDSTFHVGPQSLPDYNRDNPLLKLLHLMERVQLAAEREYYRMEHTQYLFPIDYLDLYSASPPDHSVTDPALQDSKTDFQKQNLHEFRSTDTVLVRGWASGDSWSAPFLRLSYRGGPDSQLAQSAGFTLGDRIKLWIKVGTGGGLQPIEVPYNMRSDRYEVELWGYPGTDLRSQLDERGQAALDRGELQQRPDLVRGQLADFDRDGKDELQMAHVAPDCSMHPILPLHIEAAWSDPAEQNWDSQGGANYHYEFNMLLRGWDNYLGTGMSGNPHGGVSFLEYRNLLSNYGRYAGSGELGRSLEPWNFNAHGTKNHANQREEFMAVDYMDLHILKGRSGIGLHRHRDNQEVFLMMRGQGFMVVGDWAKMPQRERCLEVRTLRPGHFAMLKGGNLHGLMNPTDEDLHLFMFGGYD